MFGRKILKGDPACCREDNASCKWGSEEPPIHMLVKTKNKPKPKDILMALHSCVKLIEGRELLEPRENKLEKLYNSQQILLEYMYMSL